MKEIGYPLPRAKQTQITLLTHFPLPKMLGIQQTFHRAQAPI